MGGPGSGRRKGAVNGVTGKAKNLPKIKLSKGISTQFKIAKTISKRKSERAKWIKGGFPVAKTYKG